MTLHLLEQSTAMGFAQQFFLADKLPILPKNLPETGNRILFIDFVFDYGSRTIDGHDLHLQTPAVELYNIANLEHICLNSK